MATLKAIATGELYSAAVSRLTGTTPTVIQKQDHVLLQWAPAEQIKARAWIERQLSPGRPGDVRFDLFPVILPAAAKRLVPVAIVLLIAGYLAGKKL